MRTAHIVYRFGPFELDPEPPRLTRDDTRLWLNDRDMSALIFLVANAGRIMTKDELTAAAWKGAAIGTATALASGLVAVRTLDVIMVNQLRDDPVTMAVWRRDRRIEYQRAGQAVKQRERARTSASDCDEARSSLH